MALSTQISLLAKRRAGNWITNFGKPFSQGAVKWFFSWMSQFGGNKDLQIVEFATLSAQTVLLDAPAKLYAIIFAKATATKTFAKFTDHATTAQTDGHQDISIPVAGAASEAALFYPQGFALANGLTAIGNTTAVGNTASSTDGANGFIINGTA